MQESIEKIDWEGIQSAKQKLAEKMHEDRYFYLLYGLLDGIQLFASEARVVREQLPFVSSIIVSDDWEYTPEGYAITIAGALLLGAFSGLGCYFQDDDKNFFKRQIAFLWPYFRDIKAIKWEHKAIKNILAISSKYGLSKELYSTLFFPLAIGLGSLSLLNRIWIRRMKLERKSMLKSNALLREEILTKGSLFHIRPDFFKIEDKSIFAASFVFVDEQTGVYYVNKEGEYELFEVDDIPQFKQQMQQKLIDNLRIQMQRVLTPSNGAKNSKLSFMPSWPPEEMDEKEKQLLHDSHVYLTNSNLERPKLVYINKAGMAEDTPYILRTKFNDKLLETMQDTNLIGLTVDQIRELLPTIIGNEKYQLGIEYNEWCAYRNKIVGDIDKVTYFGKPTNSRLKRQLYSLPLRCYLSAFGAGVLDGMYFYFGSMFIAHLVPPLFIGMLVASVTLAFMYIICRMYEEYDYQLKLKITDTKAQYALCEIALDKLVHELNEVTLELSKCNDECEIHLLTQKQTKLTSSLENEVKQNYIRLRKLLYIQTVPGLDVVVIDGVRNGLGLQGILASTMFVVVAILALLHIPCPPMYVIGTAIAGLATLFLSVNYSLKQNKLYKKSTNMNINPADLYRNSFASKDFEGDIINKLVVFLSSIKDYKNSTRENSVYEPKSVTWGDKIEPPPPYLILEFCEELRYTLTGGLKTGKMVTEFAHLAPDNLDVNDPSNIAVAATLGVAGALGSAFFGLRQYAKGRTTTPPEIIKKDPIVDHKDVMVLDPSTTPASSIPSKKLEVDSAAKEIDSNTSPYSDQNDSTRRAPNNSNMFFGDKGTTESPPTAPVRQYSGVTSFANAFINPFNKTGTGSYESLGVIGLF